MLLQKKHLNQTLHQIRLNICLRNNEVNKQLKWSIIVSSLRTSHMYSHDRPVVVLSWHWEDAIVGEWLSKDFCLKFYSRSIQATNMSWLQKTWSWNHDSIFCDEYHHFNKKIMVASTKTKRITHITPKKVWCGSMFRTFSKKFSGSSH